MDHRLPLRHRRDVLGRTVVDRDGRMLGQAAETWPLDGGGVPELLLVRMGRFARRRWVPLSDVLAHEEGLRVRWTAAEIDDAPDAEDHRWGDPALVARAHWALKSD